MSKTKALSERCEQQCFAKGFVELWTAVRSFSLYFDDLLLHQECPGSPAQPLTLACHVFTSRLAGRSFKWGQSSPAAEPGHRLLHPSRGQAAEVPVQVCDCFALGFQETAGQAVLHGSPRPWLCTLFQTCTGLLAPMSASHQLRGLHSSSPPPPCPADLHKVPVSSKRIWMRSRTPHRPDAN